MELDGQSTGVIGPATDIPFEQIWRAMVDKIKNPGAYLKGVESVTSRDNADGSVFREMHLANGMVMVENIYALKEERRIEFRVVDRPIVVVNRFRERAIEYLVEDTAGKVLGWMKGGREATAEAIRGQYERARTM